MNRLSQHFDEFEGAIEHLDLLVARRKSRGLSTQLSTLCRQRLSAGAEAFQVQGMVVCQSEGDGGRLFSLLKL